MTRNPASRRSTRAQATVEFALIAVPFFLILMSIIEVGRFIYHYEVVNSATRDGARYAIVHGSKALCPSGPLPGGAANLCDPTGARVVDAVHNSAIAISRSPADMTVGVKWCGPNNFTNCPDTNSIGQGNGSNDRNQIVVVTADFSYRVLLPIPFPAIGIRAESTLVINH